MYRPASTFMKAAIVAAGAGQARAEIALRKTGNLTPLDMMQPTVGLTQHQVQARIKSMFPIDGLAAFALPCIE